MMCLNFKYGVILLLVVLTSCHRKEVEADEQQGQSVLLPEHLTGFDPLNLGGNFRYLGQSILFAPTAPIGSIKAIIDATANARHAKADWLSYELFSIAPIKISISDHIGKIDRLDQGARQTPAARQAAKDSARLWFNEQIGRLLDIDSRGAGFDRTKAESIIGRYCEAKIWELALSPFAGGLFTERPTPLATCEGYYADKGFFAGPECDPDSNGKSYFSCLWNGGVFQSGFFALHYEISF